MLAIVGDQIISKLNLTRKAKQKISEVVGVGVGGTRRRRPAELPRVGGQTVDGGDVHDFGADRRKFEASLDGMASQVNRVVDFRIPGGRVLKLRVCGLASEARVSTRVLRVQSTHKVRRVRNAGDAIDLLHRWAAQVDRELPSEDMCKAKPGLQDGGWGHSPRVTHRRRLV